MTKVNMCWLLLNVCGVRKIYPIEEGGVRDTAALKFGLIVTRDSLFSLMVAVNCFPTFSLLKAFSSSFSNHRATGASAQHPQMRSSWALSTLWIPQKVQECAPIKESWSSVSGNRTLGHWQALTEDTQELDEIINTVDSLYPSFLRVKCVMDSSSCGLGPFSGQDLCFTVVQW